MRDLIRGSYDPEKVERVLAPLREIWTRVRSSASPREPDRDDEPRDPDHGADRPGRMPFDPFVIALFALVVALAAAVFSVASVPAAALLARAVHGVTERVDRSGGGTVALPRIAQRSVVVARDGKVLAVLTGEENRKIVSLAEVPPIAQQAVLDIEDARFYEHHGIDAAGVLRALFANTRAGGVREGGSTITQQLVKNTLTGTERTLDRKLREARLAVELERQIPKQRILELYLNEAYFGHGVYGIGTAAEYFFGVHVKRLTLPQAALLAGLINSPSTNDPIKRPQVARARRGLVLDRMAEEGHITRAQADAAAKVPLGAKAHALAKPVEPYFVEFAKQQILADKRFGATRAERIRALFEGGLRIETTLDLALQNVGKKTVADVLDRSSDPSAALVSIDPATGAIRAMVGGRDYDRSKYNLASDAKRQPGSTFKPFALVAALDAGIPPTFTLDTPSPITVKDPENGQPYTVENYDEKGEGYLTLRRATELSVNSYYVQMTMRLGAKRIADMAKRVGITSEVKPILSIALGTQIVSPLEMSSAYATLANGGIRCKPFGIVRVTDGAGKEVARNDPQCERVIDGSVAAMASSILRGVIDGGTGRRADIGRPAAGKTGTTEELSDAWFGGYTRQFSTIVWIGFQDRNRPLRNIHGYPKLFGGSLPAEIWKRFMLAAHKGLPVLDFPKPPAIPKTFVPDVVGKTRAEALKALEEAGFPSTTRVIASPFAAGIVVAQDPSAGAQTDPGVVVTLSVSNGAGAPPEPAETETPSPSPSPSPSGPSPSPSASPGSPARRPR